MDTNPESFDTYLTTRHNNQFAVLRSKQCGCFSCGSLFSAREVVDWDERDGQIDALCPNCGIASVLPDSLVPDLTEKGVGKIRDYAIDALGKDFLFDELTAYCNAFVENRINHTAKTETLYVTYGLLLGLEGDNDSHLISAIRITAFGGEFIQADPVSAINILKRDFFSDDPDALTTLAQLYSDHKGTEKDSTQDKKAYEYACRATELESLLGRCYLYDFLMEGKGCKKDTKFASSLLLSALDEVTDATRGSRRHTLPELFEYYARMGDDCIDNPAPLYRDSVRFYLLADCFASEIDTPFYDKVREDLKEDLEEAEAKFGTIAGEMMMDEHTFYDTFVDYRHSSLPLEVSKATYDPTLQTVTLTLSPTSQFILLDASSGNYRKVYHEEITFVLGNVVHAELPSHPFTFNFLFFTSNELGESVCNLLYGYGADNLVASIAFPGPLEENSPEE